jgi:hypothetical protein
MTDTRSAEVGLGRGVSRTSGAIILAGGILTALAYWLMPVATIPLIGSVTAPDLLGAAADSGSFGLLRLVPVTVLAVVVAGVWLLARSTGRGRPIASLVAVVCAAVTLLAYLIPLGRVDQALDRAGADQLGIDATNLTGAGFWVTLIGAVVTIVGAVVELATARTRRRELG